MPQQRLLYLDANRLSASLWHNGTLREEGHFPHDEAGVAAFSEYLAQHRGSIFQMLADIPDEGFQIEVLPYAQGADRRASWASIFTDRRWRRPSPTAAKNPAAATRSSCSPP